MSTYRQITDAMTGKLRSDLIVRTVDNATIPADPLNHDWQAYQAWLKAGNAPYAPSTSAEPAKL